MDFLDSEIYLMRSDMQDLLADRQISGTVIYQSYVGRGTFNPSTGGFSESFAGTWIGAYRKPVSDDEIDNSGGRYQVGDYTYYLSVEDIILPKKDDRLVDGTRTRYVIGFTTDSVSIFHAVVVRGL